MSRHNNRLRTKCDLYLRTGDTLITGENISVSKHSIGMNAKRDFFFFLSFFFLLLYFYFFFYLLNTEQRLQGVKSESKNDEN
jgi:hypothetical protein